MIINIIWTIFIITLISNLVILLSVFLSKKSFFDREKLSAFECGFDQKSSSRVPFSLQFFLVTIIFLIFDVEIVLILPSIINIFNNRILSWILINIIFILILIIGILHEWKQGILTWL